MLRKIFLTAALAVLPFTSQAMTVQTVATDGSAWQAVNTSSTVALPNGATWSSAPLQMPHPWFPQVDPCVSFCSPFDPGIYGTSQTIGATPLPGWQQLSFWATWQTADRSNVNVLNFSKVQNSLSLLWGSLDFGNLIELVLNGQVVGTVAGNGIGVPVMTPGRGAALVNIRNVKFDEVRFSSTLGGFEYSNLEAAPVALPLPLAMLAAGLGLMGAMRLQRFRPVVAQARTTKRTLFPQKGR